MRHRLQLPKMQAQVIPIGRSETLMVTSEL